MHSYFSICYITYTTTNDKEVAMFFWRTPKPPTADSVAAEQLKQAEHDLLAAEKDAEHARHQVAMLKERVARLKLRTSTNTL